jgi:hypothetical protein
MVKVRLGGHQSVGLAPEGLLTHPFNPGLTH